MPALPSFYSPTCWCLSLLGQPSQKLEGRAARVAQAMGTEQAENGSERGAGGGRRKKQPKCGVEEAKEESVWRNRKRPRVSRTVERPTE